MPQIRNHTGSILTCLLEIPVGILLLIDPMGFTASIIVALGVVLAMAGVVTAVKYFSSDPAEGALTQRLFKGLLLIAAGVFCVLQSTWFVATFPLLTILYGLAILVNGIHKIQWMADMIRFHRKRWYLPALSAVLSLACAGIILCNPFATTGVLWHFTGIFLIVQAVFDLIALILGGGNRGDGSVIDL